ncbi:MAG: hypothetical protein Q4D91_15130 [Lautropia sp.]|nr:hypothetical protein [Lautropia sp.]
MESASITQAPFQQGLYFWASLLLAPFFLGWWAVLQYQLQAPLPPNITAQTLVVRPAHIRHPPAPESGRGALPRSLVVMTVEYQRDQQREKRRVLMPATQTLPPAVLQSGHLQLELDEGRRHPEVKRILDADGRTLVPAPPPSMKQPNLGTGTASKQPACSCWPAWARCCLASCPAFDIAVSELHLPWKKSTRMPLMRVCSAKKVDYAVPKQSPTH